MITGGAGRVIASIPALEKFHRLNPNDDFKVIVHGWESLFWSHPILQDRTFGIQQKGLFPLFIKDNNLVVPEPYHLRSYYTQQKSLAEAFDEEINSTDDHSDLTKPNLYIQNQEKNAVKFIINNAKHEKHLNKVVVFQPYGSGIGISNGRPFDASLRSLDVDDYIKIGKELSKHAVVVYFGPKEFTHPLDNFSLKVNDMNPDLRMYMSLISECDYFVGCDSVGQHMARSFDKPGTVVMGSTFDKNVTYPDHFKIFRNKIAPVYNPIRIGGIDCEFADRCNNDIMTFSDEDINLLISGIVSDLKNIKGTEPAQLPVQPAVCTTNSSPNNITTAGPKFANEVNPITGLPKII